MLVKLHDFIRAAGQGGDSIAGYIEPPVPSSAGPHRFVYWRSSNAMLPAFVNCLEGGGDMRRIYTNHEQAPWARPRGPGVKRRDNLRADAGDGRLMIEPVPMTTRRWPASVAGADGPAPLSGGLHAAALSSTRCTDTSADRDGHHAPGLMRSFHHYVLAARTLIARSATSEFAGVHDHVGAILVSDTGAILAAGTNTGSYRHAEVSLLLSWFRDHPEARTLPEKSIVLSTLTPCRQCTRYLSLAKAPDTLILFDEADTGRAGRVGERIAEQIGADVDRKGGSAPVSSGDLAHESPPAGSDSSRDASATREAERREIRNASQCGRSRIERSREARQAILDAAASAVRMPKLAAHPNREADTGERRIEAAVLTYLAEWVLRSSAPARVAASR